nr:MAG TPA: hypothetical protein [Bacteriophage sp.]
MIVMLKYLIVYLLLELFLLSKYTLTGLIIQKMMIFQ